MGRFDYWLLTTDYCLLPTVYCLNPALWWSKLSPLEQLRKPSSPSVAATHEFQTLASEEQREQNSSVSLSGDRSPMPDLEITCAECATPFTFTEREQDYYQERNLTHPKRCKPCRDSRRANFGGSRGPGGERERFEITCDQCGKTDSVPFKPSSGRPVLCGECFSASRAKES